MMKNCLLLRQKWNMNKEDLGYDNNGTVYMIRNANKLEIVSYSPSIQEI